MDCLFDPEVPVSAGCYLRQMGDADHLVFVAEGAELGANLGCYVAANVGVDLVKYQDLHPVG